MSNPTIQDFPVIEEPSLYVNGLNLSNDLINFNTQVVIEAGQCRDKNNIIDMFLPHTHVDISINGVNGLDKGTVAINTWYAIYIIGDSSNYHPTSALISLYSNSVPFMPLGYDSLRYIGSILTDGTSNILSFYQTGSSSDRSYQWDEEIRVLNAGAAASFAPVNLGIGMPPSIEPAILTAGYTPAAAGDYFSLRPFGSLKPIGSSMIVISSSVAGVRQIIPPFKMVPGKNAGVLTIEYAVLSGSLDLYLNGWEESL